MAVAVIFSVPLVELFTPLPDQVGALRTSGSALISRKELMSHIAQESTVPPVNIGALVDAAEQLTTKIRDAKAVIDASSKEDGPHGPEEAAL